MWDKTLVCVTAGRSCSTENLPRKSWDDKQCWSCSYGESLILQVQGRMSLYYYGPLCDATGRSWSAEDLRRKSWDDLHKLWYVLLKERNLLLSERDRYKSAGQIMPNGRRMTKVSLSSTQKAATMML